LVVKSIGDAGADTLRQAVLAANFQPGADTITFDPTFFGSAKVITLTTGEIAISQAVTITGPGSALATVNGNNASRIFNTQAAPGAAVISIAGLTITNCKIAGAGGAILGGDESITLSGCVLSGNSSTANVGGAVAVNAGGSLTATDCIFTGNFANTACG